MAAQDDFVRWDEHEKRRNEETNYCEGFRLWNAIFRKQWNLYHIMSIIRNKFGNTRVHLHVLFWLLAGIEADMSSQKTNKPKNIVGRYINA